jgi:hypothetical protein
MNAIVIADDDLSRLEKRFGPAVRHIGPWNSDGTFGYCSVPIAAIERAVDVLNKPAVSESLERLKETPDRSLRFIEMLQNFGADLIEKLVAIHNERFSMGRAITRSCTASTAA